MDKDLLKSLFDRITVWKRGGQRAPHKPLLVLYALGRCYRNERRLIPYSEVHRELTKLLIEFGPTRKSYHPEYPFWRLRNDGVWQLENTDKIEARKSHADVKKSELLEYDVHGGFPEDIFNQLSSDNKLFTEVVSDILEVNFPASIHEDILQAVGIDIEAVSHEYRKRDPSFRDRVLRAYEYQCAVCGFNIRVGDSLVALEAAHIQWYQAGGPDKEVNGVALCSLHHKLFDRGAFTISDDMKVQVSEMAHGTAGFIEWLMSFHGKQIQPPQRPSYYPEPKFIAWHVREVFRGPSRYAPEETI